MVKYPKTQQTSYGDYAAWIHDRQGHHVVIGYFNSRSSARRAAIEAQAYWNGVWKNNDKNRN